MSQGLVVLVIAGCWLLIGLGLAVEMGRRGYETYGWGVLGTLLGPFAIVLAIDAIRHPDGDAVRRPRHAAPAGHGRPHPGARTRRPR